MRLEGFSHWVRGYQSMLESWRGNITLVAERPGFSGVKLPPNHFFTGPLVPQDEFPVPPQIVAMPRDKPHIYFAMGSSGRPAVVARLIEAFEGQPFP